MIKEYSDLIYFIESYVENKMIYDLVKVNTIFTDEYNALDILLLGVDNISVGCYYKFKNTIKEYFGNIVSDFEILSNNTETSMIIYLKTENHIRYKKFDKIMSNISC